MFETVVLGAGAAGLGPLVWAARHGALSNWLDRGVAVVDRHPAPGGTVGDYGINADTLGGTFLECLAGPECERPVVALRQTAAAKLLEHWRTTYPPLSLVGRFQQRLGAALIEEVRRHPASHFFAGATVRALRMRADGSFSADVTMGAGWHVSIDARSVILALGGSLPAAQQPIELFPGFGLEPWAAKVTHSDILLRRRGFHLIQRRLAELGRPVRSVVIGGAHSAFSAAWLLLGHGPEPAAKMQEVQILYRSRPRVFYTSRTEAIADGYPFSEPDVCQATGRVHRMGGLRGDGRTLWRSMHGRPGTTPEPRAVMQALNGIPLTELRALLEAADLIVVASGYRLATVPVFGADGRPIALARSGPSVNGDSLLLAQSGSPVPGVFAMGLGSGFRPWGAMAGETSFRGQQNSLWLYQNGLGKLIHDGVHAWAARSAARLAPEPATLAV